MNSTNRVMNRIFVLFIGLVLIGAGAAALAVATLADAASLWRRQVSGFARWLGQSWREGPTAAGGSALPWVLLAAGAVALVIAILLVIFVIRQGRGRTGIVARFKLPAAPGASTATVDVAVARGVIRPRVQQLPGVSGASLSAYRVKRQPVLKLEVSVANGVDSAAVLAQIERIVGEWDGLLGEEGPVFVHLTTGTRSVAAARVGASAPRVRAPLTVK